MKKIILLLLIIPFIVAGCSDDEGEDNNLGPDPDPEPTGITPPAWLIGTWLYNGIDDYAYIVSSDNILYIPYHDTTNANTNDYKKDYLENPLVSASIDEYINNDTNYSLAIDAYGSSWSNIFVKINKTNIKVYYGAWVNYYKQ